MTDVPAGTDRVELPVHLRAIEYRAYEAGDALTIVGTLQDSRPWAVDGTVTVVHDMELTVTVRIADLTITESSAVMRTFPHTECPGIVQAFAGLAGLQVARGYTRRVQALFGGPNGCTHLEHLARSLGPVVIQAITSSRALAVSRGEADEIVVGSDTPWARNTCHIWAEGGVADQKLAAGWRPGVGPYPSPTVATFLTSADGP